MRKDSERLAELHRLLILESSPERAYDDITQLLATTLEVPITMINMLDKERDWFKSCVGLPLTESPAETSFCEAFFHSTLDLTVVEDTTKDKRFASHHFVTGEPFIRFYAAARLVVNGQTVGTLCAYDQKPKKLAIEQLDQLRSLAVAVMDLLRHRIPPTPTA
jgi:GAF domain-containing protein